MNEFGKRGNNANLNDSIGLTNLGNVFWNLTPAELVEDTIIEGQGILTDTGAIAIETGEFTGRSPKDRFVVCDAKTENTVWWGDVNIKFSEEKFDSLYNRMNCCKCIWMNLFVNGFWLSFHFSCHVLLFFIDMNFMFEATILSKIYATMIAVPNSVIITPR